MDGAFIEDITNMMAPSRRLSTQEKGKQPASSLNGAFTSKSVFTYILGHIHSAKNGFRGFIDAATSMTVRKRKLVDSFGGDGKSGETGRRTQKLDDGGGNSMLNVDSRGGCRSSSSLC